MSMKKHALRLDILGLLAPCGSHWLAERTLFIQLNTLSGSAVAESEMRDALAWLKGKAYVDFTVEELTEQTRWRITEAGRQKLPGAPPPPAPLSLAD